MAMPCRLVTTPQQQSTEIGVQSPLKKLSAMLLNGRGAGHPSLICTVQAQGLCSAPFTATAHLRASRACTQHPLILYCMGMDWLRKTSHATGIPVCHATLAAPLAVQNSHNCNMTRLLRGTHERGWRMVSFPFPPSSFLLPLHPMARVRAHWTWQCHNRLSSSMLRFGLTGVQVLRKMRP